MFFMFRFQHIQTMNQTLQTENQTLKTVVPMFNRFKASQELTVDGHKSQPQQPRVHPQAATFAPASTFEQVAAQQIKDNDIPALDPSAPLPGYGGADMVDPSAPLNINQPLAVASEQLVVVRNSAQAASSQSRRGGLNPFPPIPDDPEPSRDPSQYGLGSAFQIPMGAPPGQFAPPSMEYGSVADRAYA